MTVVMIDVMTVVMIVVMTALEMTAPGMTAHGRIVTAVTVLGPLPAVITKSVAQGPPLRGRTKTKDLGTTITDVARLMTASDLITIMIVLGMKTGVVAMIKGAMKRTTDMKNAQLGMAKDGAKCG